MHVYYSFHSSPRQGKADNWRSQSNKNKRQFINERLISTVCVSSYYRGCLTMHSPIIQTAHRVKYLHKNFESSLCVFGKHVSEMFPLTQCEQCAPEVTLVSLKFFMHGLQSDTSQVQKTLIESCRFLDHLLKKWTENTSAFAIIICVPAKPANIRKQFPPTYLAYIRSPRKDHARRTSLRWKMIILPILTVYLTFLLFRLGECTFWAWEQKG